MATSCGSSSSEASAVPPLMTKSQASSAMKSQRCRPRRALLVTCVSLALVWVMSAPTAHDLTALSLPGRKKKSRRFVKRMGDNELILSLSFPPFKVRKIPPKPCRLQSLSAQVESPHESLLQFPFRTDNSVSAALEFPRVDGRLAVSVKDPVIDLENTDDALQAAEVSYSQRVPKAGVLGGRLSSDGEWGLSIDREVPNLGLVHGDINSNSDWSLDLHADYPRFRGITPEVSYGFTQDGVRVKAMLSAPLTKNLQANYSIANDAGNYKPQEFDHRMLLKYSKGAQSLATQAQYNSQLPSKPVRASATYAVAGRPGVFSATASLDKYSLRARSKLVEAGVTLDHATGKPTGQAAVDARLGKVVGGVLLGNGDKPKFRVGLKL
mmetsp:Transcript_52160/g.124292  ORF Transcript_52160/g.124292 Transcript_52160/m.124292 type:complete len:381 (+) Transcript_52160:46-1188(+)